MDILSKKAKLLIGIIAAVYVAAFLYFGFWKAEHLTGDSRGYYIHLPSSLLYHDVGDYATSSAVLKGYNNDGDFREGLFVGPLGKRVVKYPVGVAILEAPFFALAHLYCFISGAPADGFSTPYMFFVGLSSSFYAIWGIWLLMLALQPYFKKEAVRLAVGLTIGLATNLFYASTYTVGMSHPCLFFLYALLLLGTIRFYAQPSTRGAIWVGAAAGMIALTRSPEIISVLIPLLWGLNRWFDFPKRIRFIQENARKFGLAAVAFVFMLLPQAFYWKFVTGHWWYNGYQGESFNWAHPKILDGLFNYQNGWLIYTPVMSLSLVGIFLLRKYAADARLAILCFLPIHWYIIYSWWCWNYINGFGSRPMVEVLALLSFPLAACIEVLLRKKWSGIIGAVVIAFFIWLNLFQTWQVSEGLLLTENTNPAFYKAIFGKTTSNDAAAIAYFSNEDQPDLIRRGWQKWMHGGRDSLVLVKVLATNDMEDSTEVLFTREVKKSGKFSFRCDAEFSPGCYLELPDSIHIEEGDYLKLSVASYCKRSEMTYRHDKLAMLAIHVYNEKGETITASQLGVSARTQNVEGSIWFTGVPDVWGTASFFVRVPHKLNPKDRIKTYIWNPPRQSIYLDDMRLELWRYQ